jgi:hypothetical protein
LVSCLWGAAVVIDKAALLGFRVHLSRLKLYPYPWGAVVTIDDAAPLGFRIHLSMFLTIGIS